MKYGKIILFLAVICGCCIGMFLMIGKHRYSPNIMLQNDITETVKENMNDLAVLEDKYPDIEILVFDRDGFCVYPEGRTETVTDVRNSGCLCLAVTDGDSFLGTVTIPDDTVLEYNKAFYSLAIASIILLLIMIGAAVLFYLYVKRNILIPFREMKEYAGRVAIGDLETPLEMHENNMFGAFTESFDIMREELKASRDRENELKRREKELVAALSHDLKTPIAGINTICDVLSVRTEDEYILGKVEGIQKKTEQMENLVNDLLTSTLEDIGEMNVSCSDESSRVLSDIVNTSDPRGFTHEENIPDCMIHIDVKRLSQVVGNIIANSYKYAGTEIDISYLIDGDYLKMSITDHGDGVPVDELDLITNKFYRGKAVQDTDIPGSGLGLYIASTLMAKMNGELICSNKGDGLSVTLMILLS